MKLGYTEFSFGYAFTENLIRSASAGTGGAPFFPNLIQEAQLGYDVHIDLPGCPLYFQYKLPELMVRNSAMEISKFSLPGMSIPFFRMYLMKHNLSQQHQKLIELENRSPNTVFYATPGMRSIDAFNAAYNSATVHCRSVFFSPKNIGPLSDDMQHIIAYHNELNYAWLCSEPRKVSAFRFVDIAEQVRYSFDDRRSLNLEVTANHIREMILPLVSAQIAASEGAIRQRIRVRRGVLEDRMEKDDSTMKVVEELLVSREIARVGLGLDLIIAQPPV